MKKNYIITKYDYFIVVRFTESPSCDDIISAVDDAVLLDDSGRRMWVLEKGLDLSPDDLQIAASAGKAKLKRPSKMAVVATEDLSFGLSRVFEFFRYQDGVESRVFRNEEEALVWLNKPFEHDDT